MTTAAPEQQQQPKTVESVRRGSRWLHAMPSEEDVSAWFKNQTLHKGMEHEPYVGGVVLIGAAEKVKLTKFKQNGDPYTTEAEQAVFTPYVKVDTRISYFWDLLLNLNDGSLDGKFRGYIEPVEVPVIEVAESPFYNAHLPKGFSVHAVRNANDSVSRYLVHTARVAIAELESGRILLEGRGTKQTPMVRNWADDNAMMKAETGAIGRALGVAGILVVGTGVATAEDMQESTAPSAQTGVADKTPEAAVLPVVESGGAPAADSIEAATVEPERTAAEQAAADDEALRTQALALQKEMAEAHPETWDNYREWYKSRGFGPISELSGPALRGAVVKLERDLDAAKQGGAQPVAE